MIGTRIVCLALFLSLIQHNIFAVDANFTVSVDQPGHKILATLRGILFGEINLSAAGGIYPGSFRNRPREDANSPENWQFTNVSGNNQAAISAPDYTMNPVNPLVRKLCVGYRQICLLCCG